MTTEAPTRASLPGTRPAGAGDEAAASRQVREMFSRIAPRYDLLNHVLSLRFDVIWRNRLPNRFGALLAQPDSRVLDLCCGTGDLTLALASKMTASSAGASASRILGADFAHPMLLRAREKAQSPVNANSVARTTAAQFLEADALHTPFADQTFDLVTTAFGFRNLANYEAGIAEFYRILRPGGSLAILEFTEPESALFGSLYRFYFRRVLPRIGGMVSGNSQAYGYLPNSVERFPRPAALAKLMERAGFRDVTYERWTGGIVALHTAHR
jgi:demethylmenaquinone methyltransferase/2-methoxy-6-polyprenyl-1,4-benzoquinol methylase